MENININGRSRQFIWNSELVNDRDFEDRRWSRGCHLTSSDWGPCTSVISSLSSRSCCVLLVAYSLREFTSRSFISLGSGNGLQVCTLSDLRSEQHWCEFIEPEPPHAHPAGPPDYKAHFDEFLRRFQSYKSGTVEIARKSSGAGKQQSSNEETGAYQEFWQAPARLWQPRVRRLSEEEIDCVLVSAVLYKNSS